MRLWLNRTGEVSLREQLITQVVLGILCKELLPGQRDVYKRQILRRAGWLTGFGMCAGLLLAFALAHGVANLLYGVSPNDPLVFGSITAFIAGIAMMASWIPARRAARIDPMVALRDE